jgi:hypothetical protein
MQSLRLSAVSFKSHSITAILHIISSLPVPFPQIQKAISESYAEYMAGRSYVYNVARNLDLSSSGNGLDADGTPHATLVFPFLSLVCFALLRLEPLLPFVLSRSASL